MSKIYVTPKPGLRVRREDGQVLKAAGELVERTSYWLRRERDGDVTVAVAQESEVRDQESTPLQESNVRDQESTPKPKGKPARF